MLERCNKSGRQLAMAKKIDGRDEKKDENLKKGYHFKNC